MRTPAPHFAGYSTSVSEIRDILNVGKIITLHTGLLTNLLMIEIVVITLKTLTKNIN